MKPGSYVEQARRSSVQRDASLGWIGDAAENFEQRALASAVAADDTENVPLLNVETHIAQCPERFHLVTLDDLLATGGVDQLLCKITRFSHQHFTESRALQQAMSDRIALGEFFNCDDGIHRLVGSLPRTDLRLRRTLHRRCAKRGCFLVVQTLWAEKIQSTTDAGSLNTFGRNEIEVAPISSAVLRIACLAILYKTCRCSGPRTRSRWGIRTSITRFGHFGQIGPAA